MTPLTFADGVAVALSAAAITAALYAQRRRDARLRRARAIAAWAWQQHITSAPGVVDRSRHPVTRGPIPAGTLCCGGMVQAADWRAHVRLAHAPRPLHERLP